MCTQSSAQVQHPPPPPLLCGIEEVNTPQSIKPLTLLLDMCCEEAGAHQPIMIMVCLGCFYLLHYLFFCVKNKCNRKKEFLFLKHRLHHTRLPLKNALIKGKSGKGFSDNCTESASLIWHCEVTPHPSSGPQPPLDLEI